MSVALLLPLAQARAVDEGLINDFSDGTQGWGSGPLNPVSPTQIPDGGPAGAGDGFLQLTSTGLGLAGSKLTVFTTDEAIAGDYLEAGVIALTLDATNLGETDVELRLQIEGGDPLGQLVSTDSFTLSIGDDWTAVVFDLSSEALTALGPVAIEEVLAAVTELRFMHNPEPSSSRASPPIVAQIGVDNISISVPEPSGSLLLLSGIGLLLSLRRKPTA